KALALGIASGSVVWGSLTAIGLTSVLLVYASIVTAIKIAGALYLLWLAFKAFKSAARAGDPATHSLNLKGGSFSYFRRGLLIQLTNPKAALTWIAIMSLGITATTPFWVSSLIVILASILSTLGHLAYAVLFSTSPVVRVYIKARRYIEAGLGTFFCFASYKLLTSKGSVSS
ncbi:MAG: LysE family translocator, partial [Sneathiellales bacterium]|nr:LysE family translocator [Sneathiellales bacterium]